MIGNDHVSVDVNLAFRVFFVICLIQSSAGLQVYDGYACLNEDYDLWK